MHCGDIERSPLLPLDDGGQRWGCGFNILPGSIRRRFAALALSSYRGHRAATHHAQHAPCDLSPASGPSLPHSLQQGQCVCVYACLRLCVCESRAVGRASDASPTTGVWLPGVSLISSDRGASSASQPARRAHTSSQRWLQSPAAGDDDDAGQFKACNIAPLSPARSAGYAISSALFFIFLLHSLPSCCICGVT